MAQFQNPSNSSLLTLNNNFNNSIVIGPSAGSSLTGADTDNIVIGNTGTGGDTHKIIIGTEGSGAGQQDTCFVAGIANATVTGSAVLVDVATGQLGLAVSSERYKNNIADMSTASEKIMQLRPVTFSYKADESNGLQYGLIAEEVLKVMPDLVAFNKDGLPHSVYYHILPALLLNEVQKLRKELDELKGNKSCH